MLYNIHFDKIEINDIFSSKKFQNNENAVENRLKVIQTRYHPFPIIIDAKSLIWFSTFCFSDSIK